MQKGVSARDMSLSLGQNKNYVNQIENGTALPSLSGLFYICDYFQISPQQFFDEGNSNPNELTELIEKLKKLDAESLEHIAGMARKLAGKKKRKNREKTFVLLPMKSLASLTMKSKAAAFGEIEI